MAAATGGAIIEMMGFFHSGFFTIGSIPSMEMRRIETRILHNSTDFDLSMTPFEAGLGAFIDLQKGDFIRRAALLGTKRDVKRLFGLKCPGGIPGYRERIVDGDKFVGHVTAGAWSPFLKSGIGYARLDAPGSWPGRKLAVKTTDGRSLDCEIIDLPFYDAEKLIPRGLDRTPV